MKILKLTICNLASIAGEAIIDFTAEPLANAGIFAITGPTGSGKSTILDAMCLALFGDTPRLHGATADGAKIIDISGDDIAQNNAKNILRKNCASGYAALDFIGANGKKYNAKWFMKRARDKNNGKIGDPIMSLFNYEDKEAFAGKTRETQKEIVRILGLTFEQFCKSVLLAQGEFTTFLKAKEGEKGELLEKLTGSEVYRKISKNIFEKCKSEKELMQHLQNQLGAAKPFTDEELLDLENSIKANATLEKENVEASILLAAKQNWYAINEQLNTSIVTATEELHAYQNELDALKENRNILDTIASLKPLQPKLESKKNIENSFQNHNAKLENLNKECGLIKEKLEIAKSEKNAFNLKYEQDTNQYAIAKPNIELAKELDIKIEGEDKKKAQQLITVDTDAQKLAATNEKIDALHNETVKTKEVNNELQLWLHTNKKLEVIALNKGVILEQLNQLKTPQINWQFAKKKFTAIMKKMLS
jgi:DNA repair protein SbcC/Rad50